jgi:hypothetical protein
VAPFTAGWASSDSEAPLLCVGPRPMWLATCDWPPWRRPRHDPAAPARGLRMPQLARAGAQSRPGGGKPPYPPAALWGGAASRPRPLQSAPGGGVLWRAAAARGRRRKLAPGERPHSGWTSLAGPPLTQRGRAAGDGDHGECQSDCGLGPRSEPVSISTRELTIPINKLGSCQEWPGAQCHKRSLLRPPGHPEVTERTKLG